MTIVISAGTPAAMSLALGEWLTAHDIQPQQTYRIEVGEEKMKVFRYKLDSDGEKFVLPGTSEAARLDPIDVELKHPFPEEVKSLVGEPPNLMEAM